MNKPLRVLLVQDSENDAQLLLSALKRGGFAPQFKRVDTAATLEKALEEQTWDVVIAGCVKSQFGGLDALKLVQAGGLDIPFFVVSGQSDEEIAVAAIKAGAHDFFSKDRLARLCPAIERELLDAQKRRNQSRSELALHETEVDYRRLVDAMPEPIHVQSHGKFVYVNPAQIKLLGASDSNDLIGKPVLDFVHPMSHEIAAERMNRMHEISPSQVGEETWMHYDGYALRLEAIQSSFSFRGESAALVILRDISARTQREEQNHQSRKMEAVGRLAGGVAHDFNNIMAVILGYSGFLRAAFEPGDPLYEDTEQICKHAERAVALTRRLLAFGRKQMLAPVPLDLNGLVLKAQKILERLIGENIKLHVIPSSHPCNVKADPAQIEQIIIDLAVNARDAMPAGGKLILETADVVLRPTDTVRTPTNLEPGHYAVLTVRDTGAGMSETVREHVFEPFFTTKEPGQGGGLSLATVYGIVKQHGGEVFCYSEIGKGTTFKIYLPRIEEKIVTESPTPATDLSPEYEGTETVLFVEDEEALRELAQLMLEKKGYRVLTAKNGQEALQICRDTKDPIHLLLTDVVMPKMNGPDLARHFNRWHPHASILYTSGYTENVVLLHGIERLEINFLPKPFTSTVLIQKVREVLDRAKKCSTSSQGEDSAQARLL